jgi:hypothetical protein
MYEQAEIGSTSFDKLQTGIASGEKEKLDLVVEQIGLLFAQAPIAFEPNQVRVLRGRPLPAAKIMLARRKERFGGSNSLPAVKDSRPAAVASLELLHCNASSNLGALVAGTHEKSLVQDAARQA